MGPLADRARLGRTEPWLRAVGLGIWAFVGLSRMSGHPAPWLGAWLVFACALVLQAFHARLSPTVGVLALVVQSAAALALPWLGLPGFEGLLLSIVVAQAPTVLSFRGAVLFAAGQAALLLLDVLPFKHGVEIVEILGAYSAFTAFALLVYQLHLQERRARDELAQANADLLATRALLVEGSRQGERLRISRELHDSLGHHLTALSLQLELGDRMAEGAAKEPVGRARAICRESLAEVRRVVSAMQAPGGLDLLAALRALAGGIAAPRIRVEAAADLGTPGAATTHALFRCVQEAITNSIKHAGAGNVWIAIARGANGIDVTVRDDGRGVARVTPGRGLTGIAERVAQIGGRAAFESSPGGGFRVRLSVPDPVADGIDLATAGSAP